MFVTKHPSFLFQPSRSSVGIVALSLLLIAHRSAGQALTVTLSAADHHGYNISCFGLKDGSIHATVTGGTAPYTYTWSNGGNTADVNDLAAGYYGVVVRDANNGNTRAEITLTEPATLRYEATLQEYPNGFNVSCYQCFNGNIQFTPTGGVAPFTYAWSDGPTSQNRSGLGQDALDVTVTDVNGCELRSETFQVRSPERTDWTMNGNANTNPATQYIGTSDNKDVVFKSNGQERLRLQGNGSIKLLGNATGSGLLYRDPQGLLLVGVPPDPDPLGPCVHDFCPWVPYWKTCGNTFPSICTGDPLPRLGTLNALPLNFITNNEERMVITTNGKVGIGTYPPTSAIGQYRLFVEDGIATRDVLVKANSWPDYVFKEEYPLMPIKEWRTYMHEHSHLPGIPSAAEVDQKSGIELGDMQTRLVRVVEEQALYILQLEERLTTMEQRMQALETSK